MDDSPLGRDAEWILHDMETNRSHLFEDGDIVEVMLRFDDGTEGTQRIDYEGLISHDGGTFLHHYLHRPDYTTHWYPLRHVIEMTLVTPRRDRDPSELEVG
jgi:hypothetical protein